MRWFCLAVACVATALPAPKDVKESVAAPEKAAPTPPAADVPPQPELEKAAPTPPAGRQGRTLGFAYGLGLGLGCGMVRAAVLF